MNRFYLASSLDNVSNVRHATEQMVLAGYIKTYDWTTHGRVQGLKELKSIAEKELKGVVDADFLVLLMPAKLGSHVELGVALSLGKPVYLIENGIEYEEKSFYNLPNVSRYPNINSLIKELTND